MSTDTNKANNKSVNTSDSHKTLNEVELVTAVKDCRDCKWFWGEIPPYGPFPSHDWEEQYPAEIRNGPDGIQKPIAWAKVQTNGQHLVEPAILRGCRRSPIMTIGINPNMTAFFASENAGRWSYPWFSRKETYAYYYRYATIYQESLGVNTIRSAIIPDSEILSPVDGSVLIDRSDSHRWMQCSFYNSKNPGRDDEPVYVVEASWNQDQIVSVFVSNNDAKTPSRYIPVSKQELVAAKTAPGLGKSVEIFANPVGYYQRFLPTLNDFSEYLQSKGHKNCNLSMGEDVSMHDLVGCASPGWGDRYDIPQKRIAQNCVNDNQYLLDQVKQSRPRVIVVVSDSSLAMFAEGVTKAGGTIELDYAKRDLYSIMDETCNNRRHVHIPIDDKQSIKSRILVVPHFSYAKNFESQSHFSKAAFDLFSAQFPKTVETLRQKEDRVLPSHDNTYVSVFIESSDEPPEAGIDARAWQILMDYHYNPKQLMLNALIAEDQHLPFEVDSKTGHFIRETTNCHFCKNDEWQFPNGCDYRND